MVVYLRLRLDLEADSDDESSCQEPSLAASYIYPRAMNMPNRAINGNIPFRLVLAEIICIVHIPT